MHRSQYLGRMLENQEIAYEFDRVMRFMEARMHRLMPKVDVGKVGPMGGLFLMHLGQLEPCSLNALAQATGRDNSQLTRLMRTLVEKGLLTREQSETDGREAVLRLTPTGHKFILEANRMMAKIVQDMLSEFSPTDREQLLGLLKRV
ncbi:MAG: MarR family transcriptional regulator [Pseudomonadota bacterium]